MPTATKEKEVQTHVENETGNLVHHMVITFGAGATPGGMKTVDQANAQVQTWLDKGYDLFFVEKVQDVNDNGVFGLTLAYIFIKKG